MRTVPNKSHASLSALLAMIAGFALGGCGVVEHPQYQSKLTAARTNLRGDEIIGIWVSRGTFPLEGTYLFTTQFRPDGTGHTRARNVTYGQVASTEWNQRWWYVGNGVWKGTQELAMPHLAAGLTHNFDITWRYTGKEMLYENAYRTPLGRRTVRGVAVRANDRSAVEEHLKQN
jgi:hypothetical protein